MSKCGLLLLAAGGSRRMGRPKQLLPVADRPLVRLAAEQALTAPVTHVVVVLGARAAEITPSLDGLPVRIVVNERWTEGMGSSVQTGLRALTAEAPDLTAVIIALADQPDCPAGHLAGLIATQQSTGRSIVASLTDGVLRPPVLFTAAWFPRLAQLEGESGARRLIEENRAEVATVPLAAAADLDTPDDYTRFLHGRGGPA